MPGVPSVLFFRSMDQTPQDGAAAWAEEERSLVALAKNDPRHFEKVYEHYLPRVFRFLASRTSSRELAEDLTSQTFLKALDHLDSYKPSHPFGAWLFQIARNLLIDSYRAGKRTIPLDESMEGTDADIPGQLHEQLRHEAFAAALPKLSETDREVLLLRVQGELSHREIGDVLGKSEAAAKMAYMRAVHALRDILSP